MDDDNNCNNENDCTEQDGAVYKLNDYVAVIETADSRLASLISNLYWDEITICDKSKIISI